MGEQRRKVLQSLTNVLTSSRFAAGIISFGRRLCFCPGTFSAFLLSQETKMKISLFFAVTAAALISSTAALAQAPAGAPAGSTGLCKDGSYTSNDTKKGACSGHQGVQSWFGAASAGAATAATAAAPAAAPTKAAAPAVPPAPVAPPAPAAPPVSAAPAAPAPAAAPPAPPVAAPAPTMPAPAAAAPAKPAAAAPSKSAPTVAAPGGGAGQVWVNSTSKVYHCQGTKYYGKTKQGEYMTEAAAKAAGNRADHGKACSS